MLDYSNDGRYIASICSVAIGIGYLYPFSALTQPADYYHKLFPDYNIEFELTFFYMWVNLIVLFLLVFISGEYSYNFRIVGGFIGQFLILLIIPGSYYLQLNEDGNYYIIMMSTMFAAIVTALIDSCAISLVSQFPQNVQESLQLGIGGSTLIGSIFRIGTKLYFPYDQVIEASLCYFYIGAFTIFFCILAYYYMLTLPISRKCLQKKVNNNNNNNGDDDNKSKFVPLSPLIASPIISKYRYNQLGLDEDNEMNIEYNRIELKEDTLLINKSSKWDILQKVLFHEFLVFLVFFQTLSLWPPLITEIKSFNFEYLNDSKWWSLILLFIFSLADVFGRFMVSYVTGIFNKNNVWVIVTLRFLFIPLMICSVKGVYFAHDFFTIVFILLLGWSNGYIGTLCIIFVNDCVLPQEKGISGNFTGFFLNFGLVLGATFALFLDSRVNGI